MLDFLTSKVGVTTSGTLQEGSLEKLSTCRTSTASCAPWQACHLLPPASFPDVLVRPSVLTEGPSPSGQSKQASEFTSSDSSWVRFSVSLACSPDLWSQLHSVESSGLRCASPSRDLHCQAQGPAFSQDGSAWGMGVFRGQLGCLGTSSLQFSVMSWREGESRINSRRLIYNKGHQLPNSY